MMKTTIEVDLKPFPVPNFVMENRPKAAHEADPEGTLKFRLNDLDSKTLDDLCEQFKTGIFNISGKARLPQQAPCPTNIDDALRYVPGLNAAIEPLLRVLKVNGHNQTLVDWDKARGKPPF